ncbi:MAG: DUF3311 domain-containing protein [Candidatus Eremiobacteraeota bacterium]|nr:DUF3311 domain-containing protein [Candidatus Eremiobacteraeota bacterium]MBC5828137.1 DUF3311 domain-containing protein [Candidatus Eremiobacteraeota bacterium]
MRKSSVSSSSARRRFKLLLALPFIATLWPPLYASATPAWHGIPFFYWYQLLWVILGAVIVALVYFVSR